MKRGESSKACLNGFYLWGTNILDLITYSKEWRLHRSRRRSRPCGRTFWSEGCTCDCGTEIRDSGKNVCERERRAGARRSCHRSRRRHRSRIATIIINQ